MAKKFKYTRDKRTRGLTIMWSLITLVVIAAAILFMRGTYAHAWMLSVVSGIMALFVLSIPRRITVDQDNLEIQCVVDMTRIDIRDISSIRKVPKKEMSMLCPVLGSYGFFGYYGYYFNLRGLDLIKVYASEWGYFVEIVDIYEQIYLVSCRSADDLIEAVMQVKLIHAGEKSAREVAGEVIPEAAGEADEQTRTEN